MPKITVNVSDAFAAACAAQSIDPAEAASAFIAERKPESIVRRVVVEKARAPARALREQMRTAKPEERKKLQVELRAAMTTEREMLQKLRAKPPR